jgi:hypothetical protein
MGQSFDFLCEKAFSFKEKIGQEIKTLAYSENFKSA